MTASVDRELGQQVESVLTDLDQAKSRLHERGLEVLGVAGSAATLPGLRAALRSTGVGIYPLIALSLLLVIDQFQSSAMLTLAPEITNSLGLPQAVMAILYSLQALALSVAALPMAALVQRKPRRAAVSIITAFAWASMTLMTGYVTAVAGLMLVVLLDGASSGSTRSVHTPLLFDSYPPGTRVRVFNFYSSATFLSLVLAPALVAVLTALHLTWRGVFIAMGGLSLIACLFTIKLRDPGFGAQDVAVLREEIHQHDAEDDGMDVSLRFFESVRRVLMVPTARRVLVVFVLLGMFLTPLTLFLSYYLADHFLLGPTARALLNAATPVVSIAALWSTARAGDRWYGGDPARLLRYAGLTIAGGVLLLGVAMAMPNILLFAIFEALALASFAVLTPALGVVIQGVLPPLTRAHAAAMTGIATFGAGSLLGVLMLGGLQSSVGLGTAITLLMIPGLACGAVLYSTAGLVKPDMDKLVDEIVEEEELKALIASGRKLPMLSCSKIDFAYDQLQVLFDVSFSVGQGEMVALLGTNGAGKSTLLRVISGLGLPKNGSVRFNGKDITFLDPQRRVDFGIMQISGGKGTFPKLTVMENLRAFGYPLGNDREAIEQGIEEALRAFPRLAERREQLAGTMSGGENQMLALASAFIVQPQLLLIDELSLGLAPKIVGELLDMVREINRRGTAVVLVEQSVNIALSLVDRAYFMEKGEVRFDGPAADLLERDDLLRSVFLEGATKGFKQ